MSDFVDLNSGVFPMPTTPQSGALEAVVDPQVQIGTANIAPGATLLVIEHPRHGALKFLLSTDTVAGIVKALS